MFSEAGRLNAESVREWLQAATYQRILDHSLDSLVIASIALAINFVAQHLVRGFCFLLRRRKPYNARHQKKIDTIQSLAQSTARYTITLLALFRILIIWGVPPESLTIGGAIVVSAVGFGFQGVIQDMVTGLSLLFEEQIRIGDYVEINGKAGVVKEVGLRVIKIEQTDGTSHMIFNRQITMVSSLKRLPDLDQK